MIIIDYDIKIIKECRPINIFKTKLAFWTSIVLGFLTLIIAFVYIDSKYFLPVVLLSFALFFLADVREKVKINMLISILLLIFSIILFLVMYF